MLSLAQQADVMNAVQRLRAEARAAGKFNATTSETIATDTQGADTQRLTSSPPILTR